MPHVTLYQEKVARLKSIVTATIDDSGQLLVEGYDNGELVERTWGESDYEYGMKLASQSVEKLKAVFDVRENEALLSEIQRCFGGALAFSTFKSFLDHYGIEYDYFSWN